MMPARSVRIVGAAHAGERLDRYAAAVVADLSRSRAARLIRDQDVTVDGLPADPDYRVAIGERVVVQIPPPSAELLPEPGELRVVLESTEFVAIDKPAGISMHPGARDEGGTLAHRLVARYPELAVIGHAQRPGIVHRLDKGTSGVVLVARTLGGYRHLTRLFAERKVAKAYLLIARGQPRPPEGVIEAPIGRHPTNRTRMAVVRRGKPAETAYEVLDGRDAASLVLARPTTGRTHQIRVHLAAIGHPVVGDRAYGATEPLAARPMLHAWTLRFGDAEGGEWHLSSPPPSDFVRVAERLGLSLPATPSSGQGRIGQSDANRTP